MKTAKVICVGEALIDRLGSFGGDPLLDKEYKDCLGGAPANVACGLANLGIDTAFVGSLGNDDIGHKFEKLFLSRGVDISGLQIHHDLPSRIVLVRRDINGERSFGGFVKHHGKGFADQHLELNSLEAIWPVLSQGASWLLLGTILLASDSSKRGVLWMIEQAKKQHLSIAVDVNWRPTFWNKDFFPDSDPDDQTRQLVFNFLHHASLIKLAKEEAVSFFNSNNPAVISSLFPQKPDVIITDGSQPVAWFIRKFSGHMKVMEPRAIVDTTGAGDAFTAGLISKLLQTSLSEANQINSEETVRFAAACGALVCSGEGAIQPQPTLKEVQDFLLMHQG